jgi:hypothetical protein
LRSGAQKLSVERVLLYLTITDTNVAQEFPCARVVRSAAMAKTMSFIHGKINATTPPHRDLTIEELQTVQQYLEDFFESGSKPPASGKEVRELVETWFIPWALFYEFLPQWEV